MTMAMHASRCTGRRFACSIERIDCDAGIVELKVGPKKTLPDRLSIMPAKAVNNDTQRAAILDFATRWATDPRTHPALADLLERRAPRLTGASAQFAFDESGDLTAQSIDAARRLDHSTLCIQGPPGTGKSTTAARIICALVADGKRVGVVANVHKVVVNLLAKIADESVLPLLFKAGDHCDHPLIASGRITHIDQ